VCVCVCVCVGCGGVSHRPHLCAVRTCHHFQGNRHVVARGGYVHDSSSTGSVVSVRACMGMCWDVCVCVCVCACVYVPCVGMCVHVRVM